MTSPSTNSMIASSTLEKKVSEGWNTAVTGAELTEPPLQPTKIAATGKHESVPSEGNGLRKGLPHH